MGEALGKWVEQNPMMMVALFVGMAVIAIVISIVVSAKNKGKKKKRLQEDANLAELVFDGAVMPPRPIAGSMGRAEGYTIFAVNGGAMENYGRSVLVPSGKVELDFEYCFQTVGKNFATSFGRKTKTLEVMAGQKYAISFNYLEEKIELKNKGAVQK